jgi:hypothetical protein
MKATQCSKSFGEPECGTVEALSPESEFAEVLRLAIERSQSNTATKSKRNSSKKASSANKQQQPLQPPADDTSRIVQFPMVGTK